MIKDTKHPDSTTNCEEKNYFPALFDVAPVSKKPVELTFTGENIYRRWIIIAKRNRKPDRAIGCHW